MGGDLFAQVWSPQAGEEMALNASGRSGEGATLEYFQAQGWDQIPPRGPHAAITVPGVVDRWWQLHQRFGKLEWHELFQPAIRHAQGFPLSPKLHDFIAQHAATLRQCEATVAVFLPGGRIPRPGALLRQPDLGHSLTLLADQGVDAFYRGELGRRIVQGLQQAGGLLTEGDFAAHTSEWVEPLRTSYRGYDVTELPPNTQGMATRILLNMLEQANLRALGEGTADYYHLVAEVTKLAFADRDRWVTDPTTLEIPYDRLLSKEYAAQLYRTVDMACASAEKRVTLGPDGVLPSTVSRAWLRHYQIAGLGQKALLRTTPP